LARAGGVDRKATTAATAADTSVGAVVSFNSVDNTSIQTQRVNEAQRVVGDIGIAVPGLYT
jgi:hypothetical protein